MSGFGISPSRLDGSVSNGFGFFDQVYVDNNCAQVELIEEGASVKATSRDPVFRTIVRGLSRLRCSLFPVVSSVLRVCLGIVSECIEQAFVCLEYPRLSLLSSEEMS